MITVESAGLHPTKMITIKHKPTIDTYFIIMKRLQSLLRCTVLCALASSLTGEKVGEYVLEEDSAPYVKSKVMLSLGNENFMQRSLQESLEEITQGTQRCWSTRDEDHPNKYCIFSQTPRDEAFLSLSCPTTDYDLAECACTIGIGDAEDAPNTPTCWKCGFCNDGSLAYDCRNVAEGTCIGRTCGGDCVSSYTDPPNLFLSGGSKLKTSLVVASLLLLTVATLV